MQVFFATSNAHKLAEVRAILSGNGYRVVSSDELFYQGDPDETENTFEGNALLKARALHAVSGGVVVADDSGLEVDALGGAPGVHSKRFSAEGTDAANNALLLARIGKATARTARFRCVLAVVTDGFEGTVSGACEGVIALAPRGTNGFGYDPLFVPEDLDGRTLAEAAPEEKNRISHRAKALALLPPLLDRAARANG